mmetsp:Transcript_3499/g.3318  ORF Transcript_3499/g.3318 Transcript_3499/m.3318 type:complete len:804 (-) Transcript_3499:144-2555(-)|eukprot:CAMPEP_0197828546 /NCGR_PEP_ID=MMETSP1437-20131217/5083_1 /TAXON_ID=49252 ORGANISM="Eucampia antarctica, Strain CCMP1452" /NCGR_SAMPLE_ID=MMETSP1437 /ASSEMBLY_ACC=CAM_ASM_001096 /LENGTH=803 /DNA_ID=CAMNT_0043429787 /DNA_START=218 /DNA_END=2629 /DNA_ORIENTATION=+
MTTLTSSEEKSASANANFSKRQRRKTGLNPANTWTQHPGIKSSAARSRVYLIDAGFTKSKSSKVEHFDPQLDLDSPEVKIGRMLGSTDQKVRHKAVQKLEAYLKARSDISNLKGGFSELDLLKLWKGLWYTLYMADRVPVQDELSKRLAELMWALSGTEEEDEYAGQVYLDMDEKDQQDLGQAGEDKDVEGSEEGEGVTMEEIEMALEEERKEGFDEESDEEMEEEEEEENSNTDGETVDDALVKHCRGAHLVALYVRTFFRTVRREWANMDKYRIDKFYTAIRFMMAQVYKYMATRHWNLGIIRLFNDTIFEEVLSPRDTYNLSNGMRYHLIDITLQELAKVNKEFASLPLTEATFLDCLEPFFALAQNVDDATVHKRILENVLERFLLEYSVVSDNMKKDESKEERQLIMDQVHVGSVAQFIFEVASDEATNDRYRKSLYDSHKYYSRRVKETGNDVDLNEGEEDDMDEDDEDIHSHDHCREGKHCQHTEHLTSDEDKETGSDEAREYLKETEGVDSKNKNEIIKNEVTSKQSKKNNKSVEQSEEAQDIEVKEKKGSKKRKKSKKKKSRENSEDALIVEKDSKIIGDPKEAENLSSETKKDFEKVDSKISHQEVSEIKKDDAQEKEDEVITITKKEQKKAAKAAAKIASKQEDAFSTPKSSSKKRRKKERSPPSVNPHSMTDSDAVHSDIDNSKFVSPNDGNKKVKFGKVNYSKSYKASMRDLKTIEERVDLSRTPDKSILLCKRPSPIDEVALEKSKAKKSGGKRKKKHTGTATDSVASSRPKRTSVGGRKKASDYFTSD